MRVDNVYVRKLNELYEVGYIDKVKRYYLMCKDTLLNEYPFIENYNDEVMSIYIAYYFQSIAINTDEYKHITDYLDYDNLSDYDRNAIITYYSDSILEWMESIYELEYNTDENAKSSYKSYKISCINEYSENKFTNKFMKDCYNEIFETTVKVYFLNNKLDLEKIDMDVEGDKLYTNALYVLYVLLSKGFRKEYENNKRKLIKAFKNIEYNEALEITNTYFLSLDDELCSFEEFMELRNLRKDIAREIIRFADNEIEEQKLNPKYQRRLIKQKNNE